MGVRVAGVGGYHVDQWWSLPLTLAWFIGCTNALNLIDGVDGLAALLGNNFALAAAVVPLAGALLGFLLGCYGVIWSQKSATLLGMTAPLMVLAIPLLDVCLSIVRRGLRGQPVFQGDRGHVHHRLLDRGLTQRRVVLLLYGMCGLFAGLSLLQTMAKSQYTGLVIVLFCVVAWIGVQNLGYVEFRVARRMLLGGVFQKMIDGQVVLRGFEERLAGRRLNEQLEARNGRGSWDLRVPLGREDYVVLTREFQVGMQNSVVIPFVETLKARMGEKEFPRAAGAGN